MQKQEIEEYNKLCAIFIGWTVGNFINKYPNYFYLKSPEGRFYNFACGITEEETWDNTLHGRKGILKYHYDWNGIMKIVEKINSISICKNTSDTTLLTIRTDLRAHLNVCNKEGVIQNIHKFIKLYNEISELPRA